ncbi:MAG: aldehyde ferredoxin oxidoreductase family protein [Promethearchaeota archaeon]
MKQLFGYAGKVLRVNLSKNKILIEKVREDLIDKYLGCTGYAAGVLWEELKPGIDPLGPQNKLIFATGPLTGTLCPGSGSYEICTKSPLTGGWAESRAGGYFGPKLKFAGFDFVILEGKAKEPVYLWVHDGEAEIRDAKHLWGKPVYDTTDLVLEMIDDPEASVACIGPAGEKLVRFAAVMNDRDNAAARCGPGAVMGSKNVKAIAVNGTQEISIAQPEEFGKAITDAEEALNKNMPNKHLIIPLGTLGLVNVYNSQGALPTKQGYTAYFENAHKISGEALAHTFFLKRRGCYSCPMACDRYSEVKAGPWATPPHQGPEYETAAMLGSWCSHDNLEAIVKANHLCNNYGIDTISAGNVIGFAMECFEKGLLTTADTNGLELKWGDSETIINLIENIVAREGIGDLLAEGVKRAAAKIGKGAEELALHVKGLEIPAHDPRAEAKSVAILYATSPRGACHKHPFLTGLWEFNRWTGGLIELGLPFPPPDRFDETGVEKGLAVKLLMHLGIIQDTTGVCRFTAYGTEENCLTPKRFAWILSALTGRKIDQFELMKISERILNLEKCFNVREGLTRKDDTLPQKIREPVATGPAKGQAIKDLDGMLDEFYDACGWDKKTSIPTRKKLEELGLKDVADQLTV